MSRDNGGNGGLALLLGPVARLVTRAPRLVLVAWVVAMGLLAFKGAGLEDELSTHPVYIDGSETARTHEIVDSRFGSEDTMVVMLQGPRAALERQGAELSRRLDAMPQTLVVSPWSAAGAIDGLRPEPGVAALLVTVEHPPGKPLQNAGEAIGREVDAVVAAPVRANLAGTPAIVNSLRDAIKDAADTGEKLAIPVLLIVLLLVCRSLLAAAMPVLIGGTVVAASKGVLALLHGWVAIDPMAVGVAAMLGLALGVDYSLLVVSRYRQETRDGLALAAAVTKTVTATGRSVVPAGCGLVLAMLVAAQFLPGSVVISIVIAATVVAVLSMISAMLMAPSLLMVLGRNIDRWALPQRGAEGATAMRWSRGVSSRPPLVLGIVFLLVLAAAWATTLNTQTGSVKQLPPADPGRLQQEEIQRQLGPGWIGPLEVVMNGRGKPVTTPHRLDALVAFQRKLEGDPGVASMAGFTSFEESADQLDGVEGELARQERGMDRLGRSVGRAEEGAEATSEGLFAAADGAQRLGAAVAETRTGSGRLASGLRRSSEGSRELDGGIAKADEGSGEVAEGASDASAGAAKLAAKLEEAREKADEATSGARVLKSALRSGQESLSAVEAPLGATEAQLAAAWRALGAMTGGRSDPQYRPALDAVGSAIRELTGVEPEGEEPPAGVGAGVEAAQDQFGLGLYLADDQAEKGRETEKGVAALARSSERLDRGLRRLERGSQRLSRGIGRLAGGSSELAPGMRQLAQGAERLSGGIGELQDGAGRLADGLGAGAQRSRLLAGGLRRIHSGVVADGEGDSGMRTIRERSPGFFRSGYFYLAGFDGGKRRQRDQAGLLVNLDGGASAARMLVIPSDDPSSAAAVATTERVREAAVELGRQTGAEVVVGGWGPGLVDIDTVLSDRGPIARVVLSLVTILVLLLVTRSLALGLLAAVLNLLTVSATFGLLALLFDGSLLGGPGFVDSSIIAASVTLFFGLAIDYEVFVFARIREEYLRTGSTREAIDNGLSQTAHVITGAAVIMLAVFVAFSFAELAPIRNLGVGLAVATLIDAMIIRFVLVPAAMRALGDRSWWIPRWLDRLLPGRARTAETAGVGEAAGAGEAA